MDSPQLLSQMGTLAGMTVVTPLVSLAALCRQPSPKIRVQDDLSLPTGTYVIRAYGTKVLSGTMLPDLTNQPNQIRHEEDTVQEQAIAAELAHTPIQYQYLWPLDERNEHSQDCRTS